MIERVQSIPSHPSEVCERYATLYTLPIAHTMERMGQPGAALAAGIQCLSVDPHVKMVGFAHPCRERAADAYVEIDHLLRMINSIPTGAVVVVSIDKIDEPNTMGLPIMAGGTASGCDALGIRSVIATPVPYRPARAHR